MEPGEKAMEPTMLGQLKSVRHCFNHGLIWTPVTLALFAAVLLLAVEIRPVGAAPEGATLHLKPTCGPEETIIHLKGRNFHPGVTCDSIRFEYFWDDHEYLFSEAYLADCPELGFGDPDNRVRSGEQDHLIRGPWSASEIDNPRPDICLTVPSGHASIGVHRLAVQMFIKSGGGPWRMRKCVERDWIVTYAASPDPWRVVANIPDRCPELGGGPVEIDWTFDPAGVCDVPPSSEIVFIQAIKLEADYLDGSTRGVPASQFHFYNGLLVDIGALREPTGYFIDDARGAVDPYGNGFSVISYCHGQPGFKTDDGTLTAPSKFNDAPGTPTRKLIYSLVSDSVTVIRMRFLDSVFCADGEGRGVWLGNSGWVWEWPRAATQPAITPFSGDRAEAPDGRLDAALTLYEQVHSWTRPLEDDSQKGGRPCSQ
jgi:hypothetical protein